MNTFACHDLCCETVTELCQVMSPARRAAVPQWPIKRGAGKVQLVSVQADRDRDSRDRQYRTMKSAQGGLRRMAGGREQKSMLVLPATRLLLHSCGQPAECASHLPHGNRRSQCRDVGCSTLEELPWLDVGVPAAPRPKGAPRVCAIGLSVPPTGCLISWAARLSGPAGWAPMRTPAAWPAPLSSCTPPAGRGSSCCAHLQALTARRAAQARQAAWLAALALGPTWPPWKGQSQLGALDRAPVSSSQRTNALTYWLRGRV